ncbi:hypothetical protein AB0K51_00930 [Kitasatospora sp. NPDC049285]|uniref:hypothetical protein n=1 Tax=Kitasatospora sp. NPDC049285 TaxID=3157096 RepID=UPI00341F8F6E
MADETRNVVSGNARVGISVQAGVINAVHVHEAAAPAGPTSCQLPPERANFVNREDEQQQVLAAAGRPSGRPGPLVVAVSGMGGIGKSALSFRLGRTLRGDYPDGVLYVDLDDLRRDGTVEVADALADLLGGLGVRPAWLESGYPRRVKQYWTRTNGKRLLIVLDNARSSAEVDPLLPASADSLVIVTSHGQLPGLVDAAPLELPLRPMELDEVVELLERLLPADRRLAEEPDALRALARCCDGLPGAAHAVGRLAARHPRRTLARLVDRLTADLHEQGLAPVEAIWDAAYGELGPDAARLYRLLPELPGPVVTVQTAAVLLGPGSHPGDDPTEHTVEDAVEELELAGLLTFHQADQYRLHGLLRSHAQRRARQADPDGTERAAARRRAVHWLRRQAGRADLLAAGSRLTVQPLPEAVPGLPEPALDRTPHASEEQRKADAARGYAWLERHRLALHAAVATAYADRADADAVALCEALWTHYLDHPHLADVTDAFGTGVAAADRLDDLKSRIRMRSQLARPLWEQQRYEEAAEVLRQAVGATPLLGDQDEDRRLAASAIDFRGQLALARGEFAVAAEDFEAARAVHLAIGNGYGAMLQTYQLAKAALGAGELARAAELFADAHRQVGVDRPRMAARAGFGRAQALRRLGRFDEARPLLEVALRDAEGRGSEREQVRVRKELAALAEGQGRAAEAAEHRNLAAELTRKNGGLPDE